MDDIPLGNNEIKILNRISSSYMAQVLNLNNLTILLVYI